MASHARTLKPGTAQIRRMWFCLRMLGLTVALGLFFAIVVGIPLPGVWQTFFVPVLATVPFGLLAFALIFFLRGVWFKAKAKHFETMMKLETDPRFK